MTFDLFPETSLADAAIPDGPSWHGALVDDYGHHRLELRLLPAWRPEQGLYVCGWYAQVNRCIDEWHPALHTRHQLWQQYPWYRTPEMPSGRTLAVAQANALRTVNLVLTQMAQHEAHDVAVGAEVRQLVDQLATLTQQWLMA